MNIGQVLEIHLSLAAKALGFNVSHQILDGRRERYRRYSWMANDYVNTSWEEFEEKYKDKVDEEVMEYLGNPSGEQKTLEGRSDRTRR